MLVETAPGALRVAKQYRKLEAEALEILARRNEQELASRGVPADMYELGVEHVARLGSSHRGDDFRTWARSDLRVNRN